VDSLIVHTSSIIDIGRDMRDTARRTAAASNAHAEAFERLTMPHLASVSRFARALTRDAVRADDLVQDTYLLALRGWHTFRTGSDARPWLFKICHHLFLRSTRREAHYVEAPEDDPELESLATAAAHHRADQAGLVEAVEQMDLRAEIDRALTALPSYFRGVVVLVDLEGQSYEYAAEVLGVAVGTVRSRLFRARRLLQDLLFEHARDEGFPTAAPRTAAPPRARDGTHPSRTESR
jgi:RNA polymerase sigma-70 factor (ECF subfamily)